MLARPLVLSSLLFAAAAVAQTEPAAPPLPPAHPASTLGLGDDIPWRSDGQDFFDHESRPKTVKVEVFSVVVGVW